MSYYSWVSIGMSDEVAKFKRDWKCERLLIYNFVCVFSDCALIENVKYKINTPVSSHNTIIFVFFIDLTMHLLDLKLIN